MPVIHENLGTKYLNEMTEDWLKASRLKRKGGEKNLEELKKMERTLLFEVPPEKTPAK